MELNLFKVGRLPNAVADEMIVQPEAYPLPSPVEGPAPKENDYFIYGTVHSAKTDTPIAFNTELLDLSNNTVIAKGNYTRGDGWTVNVADGVPLDQIAVLFSSFGYKSQQVTAAALSQNSAVLLDPNPLVPIALGAGGLLLVTSMVRENKKKQVGAFSTGTAIPILILAGGAIAFSLIKKTLEALGIWNSAATNDLNAASQSPNSWWNPNFWQTVKPASANWSFPALTEAEVKGWCDELDDSFGPFNDCEECAIAIFKRCESQAQGSFLCWVFQKYYGQDLLTYLRGGWWPQDRLSDADVDTISQYINHLPKY